MAAFTVGRRFGPIVSIEHANVVNCRNIDASTTFFVARRGAANAA